VACISCGEILVLDEDTRPRLPTSQEMIDLAIDQPEGLQLLRQLQTVTRKLRPLIPRPSHGTAH
jgi:hypothetical protein